MIKHILRVDMNSLKCTLAEVPSEYERLGGRGLTSTIVAKEVNPLAEPLGPHNKLIIAPGILGGTSAPCAQRLSAGGKSPLTGGIKEANSGGTAAQKLGRLGLAAIVIEGIQQKGNLSVIYVGKGEAKLEEANDLKGTGNYATTERLRAKYGSHVGIISIGQAGEMLMSAASLAITDKDGIPCRHAARGGLGAVMGSKGIKAIVIDDNKVPKIVSPADPELFKRTAKAFSQTIKDQPRVKNVLPVFGTAIVIGIANEAGTLPTRNFSKGQFEGANHIDGKALAKLIDSRGGKRGHACYQGCLIRCSNVLPDSNGNHLTSSLEYETLAMFGSNCGIDDLDTIATLDRMCDDYGLDTIETGNAMGVAMEAGLLSFGDRRRAIEILEEVAKGTHLGRVLGQGSLITGKVFGVRRIPVIKGQGLPAWDPRRTVATGVTMITSPQGADHTAGRLPGVSELDRMKPGEIVPLSRELQIEVCVIDSIGLCFFADTAPETFEYLAQLVSALYGSESKVEDLMEMGRKILKTERKFNTAAGFSAIDDRLPEFMLSEPLLPTNSTFTVSDDEIDEMFNF